MKDMVLVDLYTDGYDAASQANQALENGEFHTIAIPFYVIYDPNKKVVATFPSLTRDPAKYLAFLNTKAPETAQVLRLLSLPFKTLDGAAFDSAALREKWSWSTSGRPGASLAGRRSPASTK